MCAFCPSRGSASNRVGRGAFAIIEALQRIPENLPPDQLDRRLLDVWNEELAEGCEEVEAWRTAYEWAVYRRQLLDRIERAIRAGDDAAVIDVVGDPALENYAFPVTWTTAIRTARERATKTETLIAAARANRSSFVDLFDARLVHKCLDRFAPYESLLSDWTRREILPLEGLGLGLALGRASLFRIDKAEGTYRVRLDVAAGVLDQCILAVCALSRNRMTTRLEPRRALSPADRSPQLGERRRQPGDS